MAPKLPVGIPPVPCAPADLERRSNGGCLLVGVLRDDVVAALEAKRRDEGLGLSAALNTLDSLDPDASR